MKIFTKRKKLIPLFLSLALMLAVGFGILTGCTPKGFIKQGKGADPIIYNGQKTGSSILLMDQFPDINSNELYGIDKIGELFFIFDDKEGRIEISRVMSLSGSLSSEGITVFLAGEKKGSFIDVEPEWGTGCGNKSLSAGEVFLYENYLYYSYFKVTSRAYIMDWRDIFYRHEFYRFSLEIGKNEEIKLTQFAEALQTIDSNFEINPDYKGKK